MSAAASSAAIPGPQPDTTFTLTTFLGVVAALYLLLAGLILIPISRQVDVLLLPVLASVRFRWAEIAIRERLSIRMIRAGDVRGALLLRREAVERAVQRGGVDLAVTSASYGLLLLGSGLIGKGIQYLQVAAWMTSGWPAGHLRDIVLYSLAGGHVFRGEEAGIVAAVVAQSRAGATWEARLLSLRAGAQASAGDLAGAAATYRVALAAAEKSPDRELLAVVNNNSAGALIELGDFSGAEARLAAAESNLPALSPIRAHLLGTRTELAVARGDLSAARESLDQSEDLKSKMGLEGTGGWTLATRARIEAAAGNRPEAKRLLDQAAGMLQTIGAVRTWRQAADAIGETAAEVQLAPVEPDPLVDRAFALARELPYWTAEVLRGIPVAIAVGMGIALVLLFVLLHDRIPGGWYTVGGFYALLVALLLASAVMRRRFPHLLRGARSDSGSP